MALTGFAYESERARLARFYVRLGKSGAFVLTTAVVLLLVLGVLLLMSESSIGWLVGALAVAPLMILVWYKRYLTRLPANSSDTLDGRLEADLDLLPLGPCVPAVGAGDVPE